MQDQTFHNPSLGEMTFDDVLSTVVSEMASGPRERFALLIGTDSSTSAEQLDLVVPLANRCRKGVAG